MALRSIVCQQTLLSTKHEVLSCIHEVLARTMGVQHMEVFSEKARLNEELYLDSVMILQLLVHLELDLGFQIPEEALLGRQFATVGALVEFLMTLPRSARSEVRSGGEA